MDSELGYHLLPKVDNFYASTLSQHSVFRSISMVNLLLTLVYWLRSYLISLWIKFLACIAAYPPDVLESLCQYNNCSIKFEKTYCIKALSNVSLKLLKAVPHL